MDNSDCGAGKGSLWKIMFVAGKPEIRILWTEELTSRVVAMWRDGKTALEIATSLGIPDKRSSILGRLHRLGETKSKRRATPIKPKKFASAAAKPTNLPRVIRPVAFKFPRLVPDNVLEQIPSEGDVARVSFADLQDHHCRYPIGDPTDPSFGYCGDAKLDGISYCERHARRCYDLVATEKRKKVKKLTVVMA